MREEQQKTIKNIGLAIAIFSGLMIFSNAMGALAFMLINSASEVDETMNQAAGPMFFVFSHFMELAFVMLTLGIAFLIGGIYLQKFKMWANRLVSLVAAILFLMFWGIMILLSMAVMGQEGMEFFAVGAIVTAIFWTIPLVLLLWYLNKRDVKENFA